VIDFDKLLVPLCGYDPVATAGDCWFDPEAAQLAIDFFHERLHHIEGKFAGEPFLLQHWQQWFIANLFGWKRPDGTRRYRQALLYIPRKNGKTTLTAGIVLYILFCDHEPGAQIYSAAADRAQAALVFRQAEGMIRQDSLLRKAVRIYKHSIVRHDRLCVYKPISAEAYTKYGFNCHVAVIDELHAQPNRELVDVIMTSTGSREQPLVVMITTADYERESICNEIYKQAKQIRDGIFENPAFLPLIYEAEKDADWKDPDVWSAVNPNLGVSLRKDYLERECQRAQQTPAYENVFKRLHLNMRTELAERWLDMDRWEACGGAINPEDLRGRECYAGLDLGATSDLTSLCLVFPRGNEGFDALWWHWVPRKVALLRDRKDRIPYMTWAQQGWIELTEGDEIDYGYIRKRINEIGQQYHIRELAADRLFQGAQLCQDLVADGFDVIPFGQGYYSMAAPTVHLETLINRGEFRHGDNPVMRWQAANVAVKMDAAGNLKPDKARSSDKIDGIVAAIMALGRAMQRGQTGSVYEKRGIQTI